MRRSRAISMCRPCRLLGTGRPEVAELVVQAVPQLREELAPEDVAAVFGFVATSPLALLPLPLTRSLELPDRVRGKRSGHPEGQHVNLCWRCSKAKLRS